MQRYKNKNVNLEINIERLRDQIIVKFRRKYLRPFRPDLGF